MSADQKDRWATGMSGHGEGGGDLRQILVTTPRSPLLAMDTGMLMAQYRPLVGSFMSTTTGAPDQKYSCACRLRSGGYERFDRGLEIESVEPVGGPCAAVFDENPDESARCCTRDRVTASSGGVCAEEAFRGRHSAPSPFRRGEDSCAQESFDQVYSEGLRAMGLAVEQARDAWQILLRHSEPAYACDQV